jgi:DNA-binding MurR/RpiR family transcriptional regulator
MSDYISQIDRSFLEATMFSYDNIQKFNETEIHMYKFIVDNGEKIPYMTIRELGEVMHVSTSTILRFCNKLDCGGYKEFKERLKKYLYHIKEMPPQNDLVEVLDYFQRTNTNSFEQKIEQGADFIRKAEIVIFIGGGSSGTLARYGARYFSNLGKFSIGLEDAYYPITKDMASPTVIIALSVSGETKEIINLINRFKTNKCNILSITNQTNSTIAKMSDWNISYNMNMHKVNGGYNATTQVPVLFLIEALARRI